MHAMRSERLDDGSAEPDARPVVLVVDDSRLARITMTGILKEDFEVRPARDGTEAWEMLREDHSIQVVISDLMMPNRNGFQLLRLIRESVHARLNQLPVIIVTGHEDDEKMRRRAMSLGASDFITKPFDALQIKVRARSYAKHGDTARRLAEQSTIDPLTGLGNSRYFVRHGTSLLAFAARQKADVAVLRLDLDRFDVLVRKLGRRAGDKVLVNISRIIAACARKEDAVARLGEARFAVIMPGADEQRARGLANRIHHLTNKVSCRVGKYRFRMTASAGLVWTERHHTNRFEDMVRLAEARLARAAGDGGARLIERDEGFEMEAVHIRAESLPKSMLSLEEAVALVKAGQAERVRSQLKPLAARLLPLLRYMDRGLGLGMDRGLRRLSSQLKTINTDLL